ncbi:chitin disaccharide deacetylase [Bacillus massiliigorillae]|uniref:chitin disaccharide deacetylase n=1 Tax=Bacillus massiliigorillae TaxID=1243664 RepID=UPI00039AA999|nr:chitin disaccharide deacetylase [Bacillus massiliigorillae]
MIRVIVNADDFGYSRGLNYGIIDAHQYGLVNSTTMMMNMNAVEHAFRLANPYRNLAIGIHLVLTTGAPLWKEGVESLIQSNGNFKTLSMLMDNFDLKLEEVEKEWEAQIQRFLSFGRKPNHFDSHHHVHMHPKLQEVTRKLAQKYNVPVRRNGKDAIEGIKMYSDVALFDFYNEGVSEDYFLNLPSKVEEGHTVEVMCHPAYLDVDLQKGTSYFFPRLKELEILMKAKLPLGCELVG